MSDEQNMEANAMMLSDAPERLLREELLRDAAEKPVQKVIQVDGFAGVEDDCVMNPDKDRDSIMAGLRHELRHSTHAVRVHIAENAKADDVIRLLTKILKWCKKDPYFGCNSGNPF